MLFCSRMHCSLSCISVCGNVLPSHAERWWAKWPAGNGELCTVYPQWLHAGTKGPRVYSWPGQMGINGSKTESTGARNQREKKPNQKWGQEGMTSSQNWAWQIHGKNCLTHLLTRYTDSRSPREVGTTGHCHREDEALPSSWLKALKIHYEPVWLMGLGADFLQCCKKPDFMNETRRPKLLG